MAIKLWSNKGVALYPTDFPIVGQNAVFNGLFKFKQAFLSSQGEDITGFFALIGDWGLGKTRIGYELFAQTFNRVEKWVLNKNEFVVPNALDGQLLQPQLAEGILPLFIRYDMVCDENLFAENWVAKVATAALKLVAQPGGYEVPSALIDDLRAALKARGVDLEALRQTFSASDDDNRLSSAMNVLRQAGIQYLWVVIDEVETLADRKRGLRDEEQQAINESYLDLVSTVIKHENYRQAHPYVNFLVLCSAGMRDKIEIGPNRRRTDLIELEPNRINDVHTYVEYLRERAETAKQSVSYPAGTLEGAFIACNRNFGWFNVMMSSIHESYRQHREQGRDVLAWQLIEEFAQTETRARWIFDLSVLDLLQIEKSSLKDTIKRLVFGQLPIQLSDARLTEAQVDTLRKTTVPGMGGATFVDLVEVHLDANTLATELVKPEIGFKLSQRGGDWYLYYASEISLSNLLAALQAFSVGVTDSNFVVCRDLSAFTAQLSALYDRPNVDILQIAEPLHGVFLKYQVAGQVYLAPSFALLQRLDSLLKRASATIAFLQDSQKDTELEKYAQEIDKSERKRQLAVCQGFARLINDVLVDDVTVVKQLQSSVGVTFNAEFQSPRFDGLRVTPDGRVTIAFAREIDKVAQELADLIGQEGVHPVIVLLSPGSTIEEWQSARLLPLVQLCAIPRALTRVEETFLSKYSARGKIFQSHDILSAKAQSTRGTMQQLWQRESTEWRDEVDRRGFVVRPLWHSKTIMEIDFARGYRAMLVNEWNIDRLAPDVNPKFDSTTYDHVKKACQLNADPGPNQEPLLEIITPEEPYAPLIPPLFGTLLRTLKSQTTIDALKRRLFFAVPDKKIKIAKQLEQILELLRSLGLVVSASNSTYRAVDGQALKSYREATSAWLNGECKSILAELSNMFTAETVGKLQKQSGSVAANTLTAVEQNMAKADFGFLETENAAPSKDTLRILIQHIDEIEQRLNTICPPGIYQQTGEKFECTPERISYYEQRLTSLPLWQHVHFLFWLSGQYHKRRAEIAHAVSQQLIDVESNLKTIDGYPFAIAPLTMPLKVILDELQASLNTSGLTSRGAIPVPGYPHPVNMYIFLSKYADGWQRLEALGRLVEKAQPESFWSRFQAARSSWAERLKDFQVANANWESLVKFIGNVASPAWASSRTIRVNLDALRGLVEGGLQQAVNAEVDQGTEKLIDTLKAEVDAAIKFRTLPEQIRELRHAVDEELLSIINETRLQALGRALTARRRSQMIVPKIAESYTDTKNAFEAFNVKIAETGRSLFENAGKQITWDHWVEIYVALRDNSYTPLPDDEPALRELEEMRLIERTIRLK